MQKLKYASVCSGIEAPSIGWGPLGWEPVFFSEIEKFPCAVLAHRFPDVPNYGDMGRFKEWPDHKLDLLIGGCPCQSFSAAGLRKGLADPRGNLTLTFLAVADKYKPEYVVFENVPGILSSSDNAFGQLLDGFEALGYAVIGVDILDAQFFGLAQRRRRVFVVAQRVEHLVASKSEFAAMTALQTTADLFRSSFAILTELSKQGPLGEKYNKDCAVLEKRVKLFDLTDPARYAQFQALLDHAVLDLPDTNMSMAQLESGLRAAVSLSKSKSVSRGTLFDYMERLVASTLTLSTLLHQNQSDIPGFATAAQAVLNLLKEMTSYARQTDDEIPAELGRTSWWPVFIEQAERSIESIGSLGRTNFGKLQSIAESLRGDITPSREKGEGTTPAFETSPTGGRLTDLAPTIDCRAKNGPVQNQLVLGVFTPAAHGAYKEGFGTIRASGGDCGGGSEILVAAEVAPTVSTGAPFSRTGNERNEADAMVVVFGGGRTAGALDVATTQTAHGQRMDFETESLVVTKKEDPYHFAQNQVGEVRTSEIMSTLNTNTNASGRNSPLVAQPIGVDVYNGSLTGDIAATIPSKQSSTSSGPSVMGAIPINTMVGLRSEALGRNTGLGIGKPGDPQNTLSKTHSHAVAIAHVDTLPTMRAGAPNGGSGHGARSGDSKDEYIVPMVLEDQGGSVMGVRQDGTVGTLRSETHGHEPSILAPTPTASMVVRRITPVEAERLQGFPDAWTNIPYKVKRSEPKGSGPCVKQVVTATVVDVKGNHYVGTNHCLTPKTTCARAGMPTGVGYELCKSECDQPAHAEVNAIKLAAKKSIGATLYLEGHTYACDSCMAAAQRAGIVAIVFGSPPGNSKDGPMYKAIGNSMATFVIRWIGQRVLSTLPKEP